MTQEKEKYKLPNNWILTTIGEISVLINGDRSKNYPSKNHFVKSGIPFINAGNIQDGKIDKVNLSFITNEKFNSLLSGKLREGDIVYCLRGSLGKNAIFNGFSTAGIASSLVIVRLFDAILIKYVYYYFNSQLNQKYIKLYDNGTAQPNLSSTSLTKFVIPLPPLVEQYRIVEKIEELFSELDKAQESLLNAQKQLEIYRQVVLKHAFEGKLTNNWRINSNEIANQDKSTWTLKKIGEIGIIVSGGTPSTKNIEYWKNEISWITPSDLSNYKNKYIEKGKRGISKIGLKNSAAKLLPKNSILFSSRAPIGYVVISKNELATNQGFKNLILDESYFHEYVYYFLLSQKQNAESLASGTTFLELTAKNFSRIMIPIPTYKEQVEIVNEIDYRFTQIEDLHKSIKENLKRLEIFRQTILQKAFSGKLVPQFETDEPASELLKRIKKEIKKYQIQQNVIAKNKPQKIVFMESNKTVRKILEEATEPIEAEKVWQKSTHKDDIEKFYEELKQLSDSIEVSFEGITSKLILKK